MIVAQDEPGTAARPSPILLCRASAHMRSQSRACTLADADVDRPPRPHARCNAHPDKGRTVVPAVQEYPLAVPEPTEAEASAVFEEVAPLDAAMPEVALDVSISIAANHITIAVPISVEEAPIAVVQLITLRKAIVELRPASLGFSGTKRSWIRFVLSPALHTACYCLLRCVKDKQRECQKRNAIRANSQKPIFSLFVYRTACAAAGRSCRAIQQGDAPRPNSLRLGRVSLRASSRNEGGGLQLSSPALRPAPSPFMNRLRISAELHGVWLCPGWSSRPTMATKRGSG